MTKEQKQKITELAAFGKGYKFIADYLGVSLDTVKSYMRRNSIKVAAVQIQQKTYEGVLCRNCGAVLVHKPGFKKKSFCSDKCRRNWWNAHEFEMNKHSETLHTCEHCKKTFMSYSSRKNRFCSRDCFYKYRAEEFAYHAE